MIAIIIVNYKNPELTKRCIDNLGIKNGGEIPLEVIIVDNSCDGELRETLKNQNSELIILDANENSGFGRANNLGLKHAKAEYVLFLNSDMIINSSQIKKSLSYIMSDNTIGVLGCKLLNEDGTFQHSQYTIACYRDLLDKNLLINYFYPYQIKSYQAVMGSFMLIPRGVLDECGLFDPDFFMYCEELELCHRIAQKGYNIEYFDGATAIHKHGGSTTNKEWGMKQRYLSTALLFLKVRGYSGYLLYHLLFIFNAVTNFFTMWFLDRNWRRDYLNTLRYYFSNFGYYLMIPFLYSPKSGNGKRMLKRDP